MENSYGIGVTNRYALLLDDDADPLELIKVQEQEKELKKKSKVAEKENKVKPEIVNKGKILVAQRKPPKESVNNKQVEAKRDEPKAAPRPPTTELRNERNRFSNTTESREERNNKRNKEERTFNGQPDGNREERPRRDYNGESLDNKGRGRGVGRVSRGGRGGRIYDQRGKREFDRQSGSDKTHGFSGVKPVDKREGGGPHNWGSHRDVIEEIEKTEPDPVSGDIEKSDVVNQNSETKEPGTDPEAPTAEEPKQITLDEWRAQRGNRQKPQYNLRKAGEGEDPTQWKKMYALNKKKEGEEDESEDEGYDASEYPQRVGRQKHILDINIHFNDNRRGAGAGGGRGRGRPGPRGARGGTAPVARGDRDVRERPPAPRQFRGPEPEPFVQAEEQVPRPENPTKGNKQNAPKVDDEHDFPSLS